MEEGAARWLSVAGMATLKRSKVLADAKKLAGAPGFTTGAATPAGGMEVGFYPSSAAWDGRFANNGWLQELPDPITKMVWGNAAMISPATAKAQKVTDGDIISISHGSVKMEAAVMIQPGHADDAISISLGYGRDKCGRTGKDVGFNANLIRTSDAFWFAPGCTIAATGKTFVLATTQQHGIVNESVGSAECDRTGVR